MTAPSREVLSDLLRGMARRASAFRRQYMESDAGWQRALLSLYRAPELELGATDPDGHWLLQLVDDAENVQVYEHEGDPTLFIHSRHGHSAVSLTEDECRAVAAALLRAAGGPS